MSLLNYIVRLFKRKPKPKYECPSIVIFNPSNDLYIPFLVKSTSKKDNKCVYDGYMLHRIKIRLRDLDDILVCVEPLQKEIPEEKLLDPESLEGKV